MPCLSKKGEWNVTDVSVCIYHYGKCLKQRKYVDTTTTEHKFSVSKFRLEIKGSFQQSVKNWNSTDEFKGAAGN